MNLINSVLYWFTFCFIVHVFPTTNASKENNILPPCRACRTVMEAFRASIQKINKTTVPKQAIFNEIKTNLCSNVYEADQCGRLAQEYEEKLKEWWFNQQEQHSDIYSFICIETYKVCCPDLHYGKDCQRCPGFPDNVCHGNGKCRGAGTRKGDGKCQCDKGYIGENCDQCAVDHYIAYKDKGKLICSECHMSCKSSCTKAGTVGCTECKPGFIMDKERGCLDINECAAKKSPCTPLQFCVNTDGTYRCLDCDRSCAGCTGDGPDMCIQCAAGYEKNGEMCIDTAEQRRQNFIWYSRYLTYLGMCIATCIILNKNIYIAAIVGVCVGIYITVSEFTLGSTPSSTGDLEGQLAQQVLKAFND